MPRLNIALDFDNTYTADKKGFRAIIRCFQSLGHTVKIVTMRSSELDYEEEFDILKKQYGVDTIFCDGQAKKDVCDKAEYRVDIWIDDWPEGITLGSQTTPVQLVEWRKDRTLAIS